MNYAHVAGALRNDFEFAANIVFELSAESISKFQVKKPLL